MASRKYKRILTTPATASYAYLREPDTGREYSDNKYKVTLLIPKTDEVLLKLLKTAVNEASLSEWPDGAPDGAYLPLRDGADKSEELSDYYITTFKSKNRPDLVDAAGAPLSDSVSIHNGDKIRVAGAAGAYITGAMRGVTLYLNGVQLVEKNAGDGPSGRSFDPVEGGFVNPESDSAHITSPGKTSDGLPSFSF